MKPRCATTAANATAVDLNPNKICDNCMKCLNSDGAEYRAIQIDGVEIDDKDKVELPE